jgi:hypothetical protein
MFERVSVAVGLFVSALIRYLGVNLAFCLQPVLERPSVFAASRFIDLVRPPRDPVHA